MKRRVLLKLAMVLFVLTASSTQAQTTQSPLPKPTGYVNDYARVIDAETKQRLETTLGNLDRQQHIQFAVVTVDTTGDTPIFEYSLAVARGWGIGSKDTQKPSLLLLVAIKDHKYFTQVSRHLEGDLPDGLVGQMQREYLVPAFRAEKYGQGLSDTISVYINRIAEKNGFSTDSIFAAGTSPPSRIQPGSQTTSSWLPLVILILVGVFIFIIFRRGRGPGSRGSGGSGLSWLLLSALLNSGRQSSSSGWSGGGFGGFGGRSGGGGFGGGGFGGFGGGGDFGGGGAGGSW